MIDVEPTARAAGVLNRYFRLLDERVFEIDRFAEVFAADGVVLRPNGTSMTGPTEIVESHRKSFARFVAAQHPLVGHDVEAEGRGVSVRANLVAMHLWAENVAGVIEGPDDFFVAGAVITASMRDEGHGLRITPSSTPPSGRADRGFASMAATLGKP